MIASVFSSGIPRPIVFSAQTAPPTTAVHIHGPDCKHDHGHVQEPVSSSRKRPLQSIARWVRELLRGFLQDMKSLFSGRGQSGHVHGPDCDHS